MDVKNFAAGYSVFGEIDVEAKKFNDYILEKDIKINSLADVERIELKFNEVLKNLIKICEKAPFDKRMVEGIKSRVIVDMHAGFAEKYKLDPYAVIAKLGKWNGEVFSKAMQTIKKLG